MWKNMEIENLEIIRSHHNHITYISKDYSDTYTLSLGDYRVNGFKTQVGDIVLNEKEDITNSCIIRINSDNSIIIFKSTKPRIWIVTKDKMLDESNISNIKNIHDNSKKLVELLEYIKCNKNKLEKEVDQLVSFDRELHELKYVKTSVPCLYETYCNDKFSEIYEDFMGYDIIFHN